MKKAAISILCIFLLLFLCSCGEKRPANADKDFFYVLSSEPLTLDPQVASDSSSLTVITALFEGLVRLDQNGNPYPGVAESWSANSDSTIFTFSLRENACWSDISSEEPAKSVTADDFVFAFRRAVNPDTKSPNASQFFCIKNAQQIYSGVMPVESLGVTASDTHTLTVELEYSLPDFPALTASTAFMPCNESFFKETNGRYGLERKYVLGNGPFEFSGYYAWEHNDHLSLTRSSVYHGETEPLPASLYFYAGDDSVDLSDPIDALKTGTVQLTAVSAADAAAAKSDGIKVTQMNTATYGLCFNTADDLMKHSEIRKAFLQTLDRESLLAKIPEGMTAAEDIISPEMTLSGTNYREVAGSGLLLPEDGNAVSAAATILRSLDYETMPSVSILCEDLPEITILVNEMIVSWNRAMGNYFNMTPVDSDELKSRVFSGNYQIVFYALEPNGSTPMSLLEQFSSSYSENPAHLKDPIYDAISSSFYTDRDLFSACRSAESYLNTAGVFYPVCYQNTFYVAAPGVSGIAIYPYGTGIDFIHAGID